MTKPGLVPDLKIPSVEERVSESTEIWARELRALFEHAKERFGDVSWESENGGERVWGHKAVIYARAPKAFKDRYFITRPFSRSPTSLQSHSPNPFSSTPTSPPSSFRPTPSPNLLPPRGSSSLSVDTFQSVGTIRANGDGVLRLTHGDTPELFQAQLEWLYTGEGFGDVVEWISAEDDIDLGSSSAGGSIRDSLGRRGNVHDRRDKLGQDLTYMWRSKLYVDVRIHLTPNDLSPDSSSEDSDDSSDSLSSTAIFTSHRFILVSRSPYFASLLLNASQFKSNGTADIHLPTPPFTPAALHFCLGYMYAGHLDFSNRTFDLLTAFQIHKAATYLQVDSLKSEIEARIVWDFCHGLEWEKCHCRKCPLRAARVWRFASAVDVGAVELAARARVMVIRGWGASWGRDVGTSDKKEREGLVRDVIMGVGPKGIVEVFRNLELVNKRIEAGVRAKGRDAAVWVDPLEVMLDSIQTHVSEVLLRDFSVVAESTELWDLVDGKGFDGDLSETICQNLVSVAGTAKGCTEGPRIYQALVSSLLLKVDPDTLEAALPARSSSRVQIESAKEGILGHVRRRWMQIRDASGFNGLESWSLKEISDEIEVPIYELLAGIVISPPAKTTHFASSVRAGMIRTTSRITALNNDGVSTRTLPSTTSRSSVRPSSPPDPSGLRRLRLSSAASSSSVVSSRSTPAPRVDTTPTPSMTGPQARSPTAARLGPTVSIGGAGRPTRPRASSPTPPTAKKDLSTSRSMSGPIRPLMTRPQPKAGPSMERNAADNKSVTSTRSTKSSSVRPATLAPPLLPAVSKVAASEAPVRSRLGSNSTVGSVRSRVSAINSGAASSLSSARTTVKPPIPNRTPLSTIPKKNPLTPASTSKLGNTATETRIRTTSASTAASARSTANKTPSTFSKAPSTISKAALTASRSVAVANGATSLHIEQTLVRDAIPDGENTPTADVDSVATAPTPSTNKTPATPARNARAPSVASTRSIIVTAAPVPSRASQSVSSTRTPISNLPLPANSSASKPSTSAALSTAPSRLRTTSTVSTSSVRSRTGPPPTTFPSARPNIRSASTSTNETAEAQTPRLALHSSLDPIVRRDGSSGSELTTSSTPVKIPPPISTRGTRKPSSSSQRSGKLHPASAFDPPPRSPIWAILPTKREIAEGLERFEGKGVELNVGIPCIVSLKRKRARFKAQVKYIGQMRGARGPWLGIEVEDLDRFDVDTLPSGTHAGVHYFHLSTPDHGSEVDQDIRQARQRRISNIREGFGKKSTLNGLGLGLERGTGRGSKRSVSPFVDAGMGGSWNLESPRVLFVRPSEVVYVLGAEG